MNRPCTKSTQNPAAPLRAELFLPQRRSGAKKTVAKRGSALRRCAFAGKIFFLYILSVQSPMNYRLHGLKMDSIRKMNTN